MKLILHIGTEKTGTTYLQHTLMLNRELLATKSIFIPPSIAGLRSLRAYTIPFMDNFENESTRILKLAHPLQLKKAKIKLRQEIGKTLITLESKYHTCVISAEHFSSRTKNPEEINQALQFFLQYFDKIDVIIYLRDQFSFLVSTYSESLKSGWTGSFEEHLERIDLTDPFWNFSILLERWSATPKVTVHPFVYPRKNLNETFDIVDDFIMQTNLNSLKTELKTYQARTNAGLKYLGMILFRRFNSMYNSNTESHLPHKKDLNAFLKQNDKGNPYIIYQTYEGFIQENMKKTNEQIKAKYLIDLNQQFDASYKFESKKEKNLIEEEAKNLFGQLKFLR